MRGEKEYYWRGDLVIVTQVSMTTTGVKLASGYNPQTLSSFQHVPLENLTKVEDKDDDTTV